METVARRRYLAGVLCPLMYRYVLHQARACRKRNPAVLPAPRSSPHPHMLYTLFFLLLFLLILTHSQTAAAYASEGFLLWYSKMVPSLLPFMILSGLMIRMGLSRRLGKWFQPVLRPLLNCGPEVNYGVLMGFLCGFPMGARVAAQLYQENRISRDEARFLLSFCNNIGPVYFCSFVLPLLGRRLTMPYLLGMYGMPLLYGIILRRTLFKALPGPAFPIRSPHKDAVSVQAASLRRTTVSESSRNVSFDLLRHLDDAVQAGLGSIISLCGYMILFNLLNLIPHLLLPRISSWLSPMLEITGGLYQLGQRFPLHALLLLPFGGLSCIAQTYSMIHETDLPLGEYVLHKLFLTALTGLYYLAWRCLSPHSFLL